MSKLYGPLNPTPSGALYDRVQLYAFDSEGYRVLKFHEQDYKLPFKLRKAKALLELQVLFLTQANLRLDPKVDDKTRAEGLAYIAKRYAYLSRFIEPKDIELLKTKLGG